MSRLRPVALVLAVLALVLATVPVRPAAQAKALDDLMIDLNITPLEGRAPPAFTVTTLDGDRLTLADVKGRAVLVYFWATW
jgi:cytochrome oxidase Cu insertion factor (SCO1/SenC/PrrC family)